MFANSHQLFDNEGLNIQNIFAHLTELKTEIRKRQNIKSQCKAEPYDLQDFEIESVKQNELLKNLKKALQAQVDLFEVQEKLCPFAHKPSGVSYLPINCSSEFYYKALELEQPRRPDPDTSAPRRRGRQVHDETTAARKDLQVPRRHLVSAAHQLEPRRRAFPLRTTWAITRLREKAGCPTCIHRSKPPEV